MTGEWLLLLNTLYNGFLLNFASQMTQVPLPIWRKWLVAFFSSCIGLLLFPSWIAPIVSFALLLWAFPTNKRRQIVWLFVGSIGMGGLLTALQAYASERAGMHMIWLLLGVLIMMLLLRLYRLRWQWAQSTWNIACEIKIGQQVYSLKGFIDTGNTCVEPLSAMPVHFVAYPAVEPYLPASLKKAIQECRSDDSYYFREIVLSTVHGEEVVQALQVQELKVDQQIFKGHYIVFMENRPKMGEMTDVILHVSMLPTIKKGDHDCYKH